MFEAKTLTLWSYMKSKCNFKHVPTEKNQIRNQTVDPFLEVRPRNMGTKTKSVLSSPPSSVSSFVPSSHSCRPNLNHPMPLALLEKSEHNWGRVSSKVASLPTGVWVGSRGLLFPPLNITVTLPGGEFLLPL